MHTSLVCPQTICSNFLKFFRNNILIPNSDVPYVGSELTNYYCFIRFSSLFDLLQHCALNISLSDPDARFHPTDIVVLLLLGISLLLISLVETET